MQIMRSNSNKRFKISLFKKRCSAMSPKASLMLPVCKSWDLIIIRGLKLTYFKNETSNWTSTKSPKASLMSPACKSWDLIVIRGLKLAYLRMKRQIGQAQSREKLPKVLKKSE
jgi:hypothetical protein